MNQHDEFYEDVQKFHENTNLSLIERQQLVHSFEILHERIGSLRVPDQEAALRKEVHQIESLTAVLLNQLTSCYETDQDITDSFEFHCLRREKQEPIPAATEISHHINNSNLKESVPH